jgi:hypothetical protein
VCKKKSHWFLKSEFHKRCILLVRCAESQECDGAVQTNAGVAWYFLSRCYVFKHISCLASPAYLAWCSLVVNCVQSTAVFFFFIGHCPTALFQVLLGDTAARSPALRLSSRMASAWPLSAAC